METGDGTVESISVEAWEALLAVNLTGVMLTAKHAVAAMRANPHLKAGLNVANGKVTFEAVAQALGLEFTSPNALLN